MQEQIFKYLNQSFFKKPFMAFQKVLIEINQMSQTSKLRVHEVTLVLDLIINGMAS